MASLNDTIAVVTINWNGWRHTLDCLAALQGSEGAAWRLYIVDNASTDDSLERLSGLPENVTLIASAVNAGWAGGNNIGVRRALQDGHRQIFLLNNDAFVAPDTLSVLAAAYAANADSNPVLGPLHRGTDDAYYDFVGAIEDPEYGLPAWVGGEAGKALLADPVFATTYVSGAGVFAQRSHFEQVGLFDERFYLNYDETDWCYRARALGVPMLMVRDAVIRHVGSGSIGGRSTPLQAYFIARNQLLFAEKHSSRAQLLRLFRNYVWHARNLTKSPKGLGWISRLIRSKDVEVATFRLAVMNYVTRRFGDCPPQVRRWSNMPR